MDIRTMQYFLAVIREGTISAAAESLHVAQPSLSRQMKDLEVELGVMLFERGNRKITLTEEGQVLRRRAEELGAGAVEALRQLKAAAAAFAGSGSICSTHCILPLSVSAALKRARVFLGYLEALDRRAAAEVVLAGTLLPVV